MISLQDLHSHYQQDRSHGQNIILPFPTADNLNCPKTTVYVLNRDHDNYFEVKAPYSQLCQPARESRECTEWEERTEAFIEKVNTILDFNILRFELKFFKYLYLAGITILLCIISYNRYVSIYTVDSRTTTYHDFLNSAADALKDETFNGKHQFLRSEDFIRKAMDPHEYLKYTLLRHKINSTHPGDKTMATFAKTKVYSYLLEASMVEINYQFRGDHDCYVCILFDWLVFGAIIHLLRKMLWTSYLREIIRRLIDTENKTYFSKLGTMWEIEDSLTTLKMFKINTKGLQGGRGSQDRTTGAKTQQENCPMLNNADTDTDNSREVTEETDPALAGKEKEVCPGEKKQKGFFQMDLLKRISRSSKDKELDDEIGHRKNSQEVGGTKYEGLGDSSFQKNDFHDGHSAIL